MIALGPLGFPPLESSGDDRGFTVGGAPTKSRAFGVVNFENGTVVLTVLPSCGTGGWPADCHDAKAINSNMSNLSDWAEFLPFVESANKVNVSTPS